MRAVLILVAAILFGLAGGYGWSAMTPKVAPASRAAAAPPPKPTTIIPADLPQTADDRAWTARAQAPRAAPAMASAPPRSSRIEQSVTYSGCNAVRAAGKAPLYAGQPGYRPEMDGDGDGIACEPIRGR